MTVTADIAAGVKGPAQAFGGLGGVPARVWTACTNGGCPNYGDRRQIGLPRVARGVVALPTLLCEKCGHVLPLDWSNDMPKNTVHSGSSNQADLEAATPVAEPVVPVVPEPTPEPELPAELADVLEVQDETPAPAAAAKKTAARKRTG